MELRWSGLWAQGSKWKRAITCPVRTQAERDAGKASNPDQKRISAGQLAAAAATTIVT